MKSYDVAKNIEQQYTTDISRYSFDKTLCLSCPHYTNNMMLFCEGGCGNCSNRTCLAEMNTSFLVEKAVQLMEQYPCVSLCHQEYNYDEATVESLSAMGYEVERLKTYATAYPEQPEAPEAEDYDTTEEYEEAKKEYEQDLNDYKAECEEIDSQIEAGETSLYIRIERNDIDLCYMRNVASADETVQEQLSPMQKLVKQDKRNKEIALEKTVEDTKKQILEVDVTEAKFGADEDKMIYFFLLSSLRREHFTAVGIDEEHSYYLSDEEKMNIIANLTAKEKALIRRDFLIANFKGAYGSNAIASLLLDFAEKHMPDDLANIKNGHNEVYEKRHTRIEEKKAALLVQEQAEQEEAVKTEEAKPKTEVQPEEYPQSEEVAA